MHVGSFSTRLRSLHKVHVVEAALPDMRLLRPDFCSRRVPLAVQDSPREALCFPICMTVEGVPFSGSLIRRWM
jgi:hypothetical protein